MNKEKIKELASRCDMIKQDIVRTKEKEFELKRELSLIEFKVMKNKENNRKDILQKYVGKKYKKTGFNEVIIIRELFSKDCQYYYNIDVIKLIKGKLHKVYYELSYQKNNFICVSDLDLNVYKKISNTQYKNMIKKMNKILRGVIK
jgi:hypothetical protein